MVFFCIPLVPRAKTLIVCVFSLFKNSRRPLRCWCLFREGQRSWQRVWRTYLMSSGWGNWDPLARRKEDSWVTSSLSTTLYHLKGGSSKVDVGLFSWVRINGTKRNGLKLHQGRFTLVIRKDFFIKRVVKLLESAVQGSGGVTIPGSI